MRIREFLDFTPLRAALVLCAAAAAFALWALASAFRAPAVPAPAGSGTGRMTPLQHVVAGPAADIDAVVDEDLFAPDRAAPAEPFHMPGEASATVADTPPAKPTVLGTAIGPAGASFATTQFGDTRSHIVHVGDHVGPYTVSAITRGHVVFTTADGDRLDIAEQTASTQENTNASLDNSTMPLFPVGRGGRAFFGFGAAGGQGRRGRRGAAPDSLPFRD